MTYCVYILSGKEGEVLYVGHTANLRRRMAEHSSRSWASEIAEADAFEMPSKNVALYVERNYIEITKPRYNVQSKPCPIRKMIREERDLYDRLTSD